MLAVILRYCHYQIIGRRRLVGHAATLPAVTRLRLAVAVVAATLEEY